MGCISLLAAAARRLLVSRQGIKPAPPAVEVWSLNYWTTREVPSFIFKRIQMRANQTKRHRGQGLRRSQVQTCDFHLRNETITLLAEDRAPSHQGIPQPGSSPVSRDLFFFFIAPVSSLTLSLEVSRSGLADISGPKPHLVGLSSKTSPIQNQALHQHKAR